MKPLLLDRQDDSPTLIDAVLHPFGELLPAAPDVAYLRTAIVNVYFIGPPGAPDRGWVLVDAGIHGSAHRILTAAGERYGAARPGAIVLTHGHFDHVGAVRELAAHWDVPVYAHPLELPYLDGSARYPRPDPTVGGGSMALLSMLYPRGPIDLGERLRSLPADGLVPELPDWQWLHTPGHTDGHVSLFREEDRVLIAGDAVITVKQESALAVWSQRPEVHGPPQYYTPDWNGAAASARLLASLRPETLASGHGVPLHGDEMQQAMQQLALEFEQRAIPEHGRYVFRGPRPEHGKVGAIALLAGAVIVGVALASAVRERRLR